MNKLWQYVLAGIATAFGGLLFAVIFANVFNGLDLGIGIILGNGLYLCVVVVTCTGIVVSKLDKNSSDSSDK